MEKTGNDVKNVRQSKTGILVASLVVLAVFLLILGNYLFSRQNPGGTDFLVHWTGLRLFFKEGVSPYSDQAALTIQNAIYGHAATPGQHEFRVAYHCIRY